MAIDKLEYITVVVADQDAAYDFYVNKVGLEVGIDHDMGPFRFLTVSVPGAGVQLVLAKEGSDATAGLEKGGFSGIVFGSKEIQATYEDLSSKGVDFPKAPEARMPGGPAEGRFADPDGNEYVLHEIREMPAGPPPGDG